jgi:hypothetical protein
MEEIKPPKKERRFLKAVGEVALTLFRELLLGVGKKVINKVGNKRQGLVIAIIILASSFAFAQYPNTGNKQRLGFQTTADGLVWRGSISDTASIQPVSNQNAWVILDTVNLKIYSFDFSSNVWNQVGTGGGSAFTQPVDSLFFNVSVPTNNVDTAKMRWDSDLATVVLGLNDNVPNELGFKNFWLVKNQTGSTITKGSIVYANGTVGASGRITVAKFIANGTIDAKYLLGITAHDLSNGEDGYVISFGKIRQVNTDTFAAGAILYPSPTTAGVWTDVEPIAPNIDMPIGFCINSHVNNGTIAIRVASGYSLNELHDVQITSPVDRASLYYRGGLWRDTTAALLVSDTASMLTNYLRSGVAASTYVPLNTSSTMNANLSINGNLTLLTGGILTTPILSSGLIIKQGGTTSQFLKANGDIDSTNYLSSSSAASTYLPLTGGTLTGALNGTTGRFNIIGGKYTWDNGDFDIQPFTNYSSTTFGIKFDGLNRPLRSLNFYFPSYNEEPRQAFRFIDSRINAELLTIELFSGNVGINKVIPAYKLDVNGTLGVTGQSTFSNNVFVGNFTDNTPTSGANHNIRLESNDVSSIGFHDAGNTIANIKFSAATGFVIGASDGTFGPHSTTMAGATTTGALTVKDATVFNEDSGDFDTRIESDGNANMVFVDASTDRVGIGTGTPSKTLDVNGEVRIATVTATPTALLGKDASNVVGELGLGTGMSVSGGILSVQAAGASATGLVTSFGTQIFGGIKTFNEIVNFNKNISLPIVKINNANYTATTSDHTIIYTTLTSDKTLTIPNAADATGIKYTISIFDIPEGNEALTLITPSSNLFVRTDGESSNVDIVGGYCTTIQSDGTKWYILSYAPMY